MRSFLKKHRKRLLKLGAILFVLSIYPLFVLIYTWSHVYQSGFQGGKHGPLDAYRHTLASAVVSYTVGEWAVKLTTNMMESKNSAGGQMDRHEWHVIKTLFVN